MPPLIDKAKSLEKLLRYLDCSRKEMVACGDGLNDLTMIEYAGIGVAMDNAQPVLKENLILLHFRMIKMVLLRQ